MANEKNLVPNSQRSPSEVRENAAKGGRASGKARKAKAKLKKILQDWATGTPTEDELVKLEELGITTEGATRKALLLVPILQRAITGDLKAVQMAIQLLNEDDKQNAEIGLLHAEIDKLKTENKLLLQKANENSPEGADNCIKVIFDDMSEGDNND